MQITHNRGMNAINRKLKWNSKPRDFVQVIKFKAHGEMIHLETLSGKPKWLRPLRIPRHNECYNSLDWDKLFGTEKDEIWNLRLSGVCNEMS